MTSAFSVYNPNQACQPFIKGRPMTVQLVVVLASPLREELTIFCNTGAGMKLFTLDGMRSIVERQYFKF